MYPRLHVQLVKVVEDTGENELAVQLRQVVTAALTEYVPAEQTVHAALPVVGLKVPIAHCEQVPPFGPVNPRLQVQFWMDRLWMGEFEFTGHVRHVEAAVAAV